MADASKPPRHSANVRRVSVYSARKGAGVQPSSRATGPGRGEHDKGQDQDQALDQEEDGHVRVAVRCRPMSSKETGAGFEPIVEFESASRIVVHDVSEQPSDQLGTKSGERRNISHVYDFDQVFDCTSRQADVYESAVRPLIDQVLLGYNCTVFAYGQTGTGKTYTMEGCSSAAARRQSAGSSGASSGRKSSSASTHSVVAADNNHGQPPPPSDRMQVARPTPTMRHEDQAGIIPRTFEQIFEHVDSNPQVQFLIRASYLEIYQEEIRDLLRKDSRVKLELHERSDIGVYVKDLTSFVCKSISEIERVMRVGNQNRIVAATDMNEHSSRSHAIFTITIEQQQQQQQQSAAVQLPQESLATQQIDTNRARANPLSVATVETKQQLATITKAANNGSNKQPQTTIRVGKLNLVDLAGSERQRKTNSFGQRQKESIKINLSLSALGNVINSLMRLQQQRQQQNAGSKESRENNKQQQQQQQLKPIHTPYRDSKLTRLLQDSLGGNSKTLMIAHIGPASYNYDETINTLNYASRARCIRNAPRLNEDPKDALLRQLQREIDLLRAKLAEGRGAGSSTSTSDENATKHQRDNLSSGVSSSTTASDHELAVERELVNLRQKLASIEGKILNCGSGETTAAAASEGAKNPIEHRHQHQHQHMHMDHQSLLKGLTREQELELERRQEALARQVERERAIRDELERREEAELLARRSFESVQQEVEAKRRLTWKVVLRVKALRDEIASAQQAYRRELDELDELQWALQRELKLKCLIMDNFIPNAHVDALLSRVTYNERRSQCAIEPLELPARDTCLLGARNSSPAFKHFWRPSGLAGDSPRPRSEMERIGETIYPGNIRYKFEELIEPRLEAEPPPHPRASVSRSASAHAGRAARG